LLAPRYPRGTRSITLSHKEQRLLTDVIDNWLEGIDDARIATIEDPTITDPEAFLKLIAGYDVDAAMLNGIRKRLQGAK